MLRAVTFVVLTLCLFGYIQAYTSCGTESDLGILKNVHIPGCDNVKRCILKRNTNISIDITFTPKEETKVVKAVVHGVILSVPMPFNLPQPDGCVDSGLTCPLKANQEVTYTAELPIIQQYPRITVDVKWELQAEDEKTIVCVLIPSKIQ